MLGQRRFVVISPPIVLVCVDSVKPKPGADHAADHADQLSNQLIRVGLNRRSRCAGRGFCRSGQRFAALPTEF